MRTREIDDKVWYIAAPTGALLTLLEILTTPNYPLLAVAISAALGTAVALALYYTGLWGGADVKALVTLAVTLPLPPYQSTMPLYTITVLLNGIVLLLLQVPTCLLWNTAVFLKRRTLFEGVKATRVQKLLALIMGMKVSSKTAASIHFFPMEVSINGTRALKPIQWGMLKKLASGSIGAVESETVWVEPVIPFIVFLLAGFLLSFLTDCMILRLISFVWGWHF